MIYTDNYYRWKRVEEVNQTPTGILAELHGERLRIDVVRADVVRIKISRGGVFDESPTFAVCVDPLATPARLSRRADGERVRLLTTRARRVAVARPVPPRRAPHRRLGRVETAPDADGRYWAYATLNDAFTIRRRCRPEDAIYGLGEKTRPPQPQGPRLHAVEHRRARARRDRGVHRRHGRRTTRAETARASSSTRTTSRSRSSTTRRYPAGSDGGVVRRQRLPRRRTSSPATRSTAIHFARRPVHRVRLRRPGHARHPRGLHLAHRAHGAAAAVVARLPPVPLVRLHAGRRRGARAAPPRRRHSRATRCGSTSSTWTATASSRGTPSAFPDAAGHARAPGEQGLPGHHDHRPGRQVRPGLLGLRPGASSATCCASTEGGDIYIGQVWPGNTAFPDFVTEEARAWWGELNAAHVRVRAGRHLERHERAGDRRHPARARCASTAAEHSHERYHNQYALLMAMGTTAGPARRRCPTGARSCCRAPASPASSATPPTGWATTSRAGTTCG